MNSLTAQKFSDSQREANLRQVAEILKTSDTIYRLVDACTIVGINPQTLTQKEINFIKKLVG